MRQTDLVTEGEQMNEKQRQEVTEGESVVRMGIVQKKRKQEQLHGSKEAFYMSVYACISIYVCAYLCIDMCMCVCVCLIACSLFAANN